MPAEVTFPIRLGLIYLRPTKDIVDAFNDNKTILIDFFSAAPNDEVNPSAYSLVHQHSTVACVVYEDDAILLFNLDSDVPFTSNNPNKYPIMR